MLLQFGVFMRGRVIL